MKVHSTATQIALAKHCSAGDIVTSIYPTHSGYTPRGAESLGSHASLEDLKNFVGEDTFNEYHKIVGVRNTWDRLVTLYLFFQQENLVPLEISFEQFLLNHNAGYTGLLRYSNIQGILSCDSIIDFSNLKQDLNQAERLLGLEETSIMPKAKEETFRTSHYSEFYTDTLVDLVYNIYREEIELFDFKFEESQC